MKDRDFLKGKQDGKNEITNIVENHNKLKYLQQCREIDTEVRSISGETNDHKDHHLLGITKIIPLPGSRCKERNLTVFWVIRLNFWRFCNFVIKLVFISTVNILARNYAV